MKKITEYIIVSQTNMNEKIPLKWKNTGLGGQINSNIGVNNNPRYCRKNRNIDEIAMSQQILL